jgi:hypothetical protein
MKRFVVCFCLVVSMIVPTSLFSQTPPPEENNEDIEAVMKKLAEGAARAYVNPVVSGFGANLNSGWFHRAPWATMFGFDLEFGVVGMATFFKDENRTFSSGGSFRFTDEQATILAQQSGAPAQYQQDVVNAILSQEFQVSFNGPTIVGSKLDSMKVGFPGKQITVSTSAGPQTFNLPAQLFALPVTGLFEDAQAFPLGTPQLTIGTFLGSQFTFRYLPDVKIDEEIGSFKYFGFGIQHNPMVWFGEDALPFEVSLGYFNQSLKVGDLMNAKATAFGVNASIRLGWGFLNLTPYIGYMKESSTIDFAYKYTIDTPGGTTEQNIAFGLESENKSRLTLGASIKILLINVNADINFGKYRTISGGIMIII